MRARIGSFRNPCDEQQFSAGMLFLSLLSWLQLRKSEVSWGENLTPEVLAERSTAARPAYRSAAQPRILKVLLRSGNLWENIEVPSRFLN